MQEYIYLIYPHEHRRCKDNIYKLGKTTQAFGKRTNSYPKNSLVLCQVLCNGCDLVEKRLIEHFKQEFKHCADRGDEYFEGDPILMARIIMETCLHSFEGQRFELPCDCDSCPKEFRICENPIVYHSVNRDEYNALVNKDSLNDVMFYILISSTLPKQVKTSQLYNIYVNWCLQSTKNYTICEPVNFKEFNAWVRNNLIVQEKYWLGFFKSEFCMPYELSEHYKKVLGKNKVKRLEIIMKQLDL